MRGAKAGACRYDGQMDIGVFVAMEPHDRGPAEDVAEFVDLAQVAEELGYHSLWMASRHFSPGYASIPAPLVLLAAAAERTRNLVLGTSVVSLPLENPLRLAEDFAVLDALSGGRARLGLGSGDDPPAFAALGVDFEERAGLLSRELPGLLKVLGGDEVGPGLTLYPPVEQALSKLALGAQSARGAAWAASMQIGLLQGRAEPNSADPTLSQTRAAESYRAVHPEGRVVTARNAWVGTLEDPELLEGMARYDRFHRSRGRAGLPSDHREALRKMHMVAGPADVLARDLRARVASIAPDELVVTPDPCGLEASDRVKRLTALAEAFGLRHG